LTLGLSASQIDDVVKNKRLVDSLPIRAPMDGAIAQFDRVLGQVVRADEPLFEMMMTELARATFRPDPTLHRSVPDAATVLKRMADEDS
jgi:hypothetical protein